MKHSMKLLSDPFESIKNGTKTIEFRLYDEKRKNLKIDDEIEFSKLPDLNEKIIVTVEELYKYSTFKELFNYLNIKDYQKMYLIYTKAEEKEYGVIGIKIKVIK